jgi:hypothetical protein
METLIEEIPLQTTPQRFGNKAFRDWLEKVTEVRIVEAQSASRVQN